MKLVLKLDVVTSNSVIIKTLYMDGRNRCVYSTFVMDSDRKGKKNMFIQIKIHYIFCSAFILNQKKKRNVIYQESIVIAPLQINLDLTDWVNGTERNDALQHDCLHVAASTDKDNDPRQIISYCMSEWPSKWTI
jgi:hypothetical protein